MFLWLARYIEKIVNSFQNKSYENKLSKIDWEFGNGCLKAWKNDKVFLCNDIAQIISEICGFQKEPAPALNWGKKSICLDNLEQRELSRSSLKFLCRPWLQHPTFDMILGECKQLPLTFQLWVRGHCVNGGKTLDFVISSAIKQCKCIKNLMLILCLQPVNLLKKKLEHRCFLVNFENFWKTFL